MTVITEGNLRFTFPANVTASKLDEWSFYRNQFERHLGGIRLACKKCNADLLCRECESQKSVGVKSVDIVALDANSAAWFIEIKDYRRHRRTKTINLADEIAIKVKDSLALVLAAAVNANDVDEKTQAQALLRATTINVVLHLEQPVKTSRLFPRAIDPAAVKQRLRQLIRAIDHHPSVVEVARMPGVIWTVT